MKLITGTKRCVRMLIWAVSLSCLTLNAYNLPALGNSNEAVLTTQTEKRLGLALYEQIHSQVKVLQDPLLQDYIQNLGDRLIGNADKQPFTFHFFFIEHGAVNAFTGPGGYVAIHTGLITAVKNESELAAVMAHEVSHATQRHISRGLERAKVSSLANIGALVAAAAIGVATKNGDAATGALMSAQALNVESHLGFSRAQEQEADRLGINLLYRSGYNPNSMPDFLQTLDRIAGTDRSLVAELLSTHPLTDSRIADTQNRARQFEPKPYRTNNLRFNLIRARVSAQITRHPDKLQRFFVKRMTVYPEQKTSLQYGYALAAMKQRQYDKAIAKMSALQKAHPYEVIFTMGLAEIYDHQGHFQQAIDVLAKQYRWTPEYLPLVQQYTSTLLAANHPDQTLTILEKYSEEHTLTTGLIRLQAKTYAKLKQMSKAYLLNAKADLRDGRYRSAYRLAKQGLKFKSASTNTRRSLKEVMKSSRELNVPIKL